MDKKKELFKIVILGDSGQLVNLLSLNQCWKNFPYELVSWKIHIITFIQLDMSTRNLLTLIKQLLVLILWQKKLVLMIEQLCYKYEQKMTISKQIWDTAGQERFQSQLGSAFYRGSDCCIIVFDITKEEVKYQNQNQFIRKSFSNLNYWKDTFLKYCVPKDPQKFPFILLGNKLDKQEERKVFNHQAKKWAEQNGNFTYFETSAKDATNINVAFEAVAKEAAKFGNPSENMMPGTVTLMKQEDHKNESKCC